MWKRTVSVVALLTLMLTPVLADQKIVKLRGGRELKGDVSENADGSFRVETQSGVVVTVPAKDIVSIEDIVTPKDEYEKLRRKADPNSFDDQYSLAEWAFKAELYQQAKEALGRALKIEDSFKARQLLRRVEEKLKAPPPEEPPKPPNGDRTKPPTSQPGTLNPKWLLGEKDIAHIRLEELRDNDVVAVRFEKGLIERFIKMMRGRDEFESPQVANQFRALSPVRKARYIISKIDRDDWSFKGGIDVRSDPKFMVEFRSHVWPIARRYCTEPQGHNAVIGLGDLKLFSVAGTNVRADYTNFLILSAYRRRGGRMIHRDNADMSLLLQYGLPPEQAQYRHPGKISPIFTSRNDPTYVKVRDWIENLRRPRQPDYNVQWKPPFGMRLDLTGKPTLPPPDQPTTQPEKNGQTGPPI